MRRRVTDLADRIRTVIDKLDDTNNNSSCACPARRSRSDSASRSTHWIPARPEHVQHTSQPVRAQRPAKTVAFPPWSPTDSPTASRKQPPAGSDPLPH
jgi:hypothetical protein